MAARAWHRQCIPVIPRSPGGAGGRFSVPATVQLFGAAARPWWWVASPPLSRRAGWGGFNHPRQSPRPARGSDGDD